MEFVTIHELSRMSGVSTATIRLDIKAGKLPIASQGSRGRGNPTRIRIADLEHTERSQYQQLARRFLTGGVSVLTENGKEKEKLSVNELAMRTGLSPQVVRKDIIEGKLKAEGGGRRGSPYYIFLEDLAAANRIEYRRLIENRRDFGEQGVQSEIVALKKEIQSVKERLAKFERVIAELKNGSVTEQAACQIAAALGGQPPNVQEADIIEVQTDSVSLPAAFERYHVSEERIKRLKDRIYNGEALEPVQVRRQDDGSYILRRGIAQYHVARELGLPALPAYLESEE